MRPKFTIANLLMLTVIVAMAVLMYQSRVRIQQIEARHRVRVQHLKAQLALHEAVRAQARRVHERRSQLQAAGALATESATAWKNGVEFTFPVGVRRARAEVVNLQLRLVREEAILADLEKELQQREENECF